MNTVLEGSFGQAYADSRTSPTVARLDSGGYTVLGGDPGAAAASALVRHQPIIHVTPETSAWEGLLRAEYGERLRILRYTECLSESLQAGHLTMLIRRLPAGFELVRIDDRLAAKAKDDLSHPYLCECFHSIEDLVRRGLGYCILHESRVVSAAASMAACDGAIEIEILTDQGFRQRGLGTCAGAKMALACLERGIEPVWVADNPTSLRLAQRLGYEVGDTYESFIVQHASRAGGLGPGE